MVASGSATRSTRDVLERGLRVRPQQAREAAQVLAQHGVLLVRHRRAALLAGPEPLLGLADLGALPVPHAERDLLDRGAEQGERAQHLGVAVARDDLGRDGLGLKAELVERLGLDLRVKVAVHADRAGDLADRDRARRARDPLGRARDLGVPARERQPGGDRLGVDAVRPADHRRGRMLACAPGERGLELADRVEDLLERADALDRERGVEHVGRRHAEVEPARRLAGELLDVGQERDHVVARGRLDLEDPPGIELAGGRGADLVRGPLGHAADPLHGPARGELDAEPQLEAMLVVPQRGELGSTVARDHREPSAPLVPNPGAPGKRDNCASPLPAGDQPDR
jgi:hypothetical protein